LPVVYFKQCTGQHRNKCYYKYFHHLLYTGKGTCSFACFFFKVNSSEIMKLLIYYDNIMNIPVLSLFYYLPLCCHLVITWCIKLMPSNKT
jgi:hypothetical protein